MPTPSARPVAARILWPALGFPAVIAPRANAQGTAADSDATRTICVLLLSNTPTLSSQDAARYLRCVPWAERTRRSIKAGDTGSFSPAELTVRNGLVETGAEDPRGKALSFGANRQQQNGITVSLSKYVRRFYGKRGIELKYLHNDRWNFYGGTTVDDPDNGDLPATGFSEGFTAYLGVVRTWTKTFRTGVDATFWETLYANDTRGNAVRFDFYAVMDF